MESTFDWNGAIEESRQRRKQRKEKRNSRILMACMVALVVALVVALLVSVKRIKAANIEAAQFETWMYQEMDRADSLSVELNAMKSASFSKVMKGEY